MPLGRSSTKEMTMPDDTTTRGAIINGHLI
jgi:hypothetical protein